MSHVIHNALFEQALSTDLNNDHLVSKTEAVLLFSYFMNSPLFRWKDKNNNCENRANAICILLDKWKITNNKGWVFSGSFLKKENSSEVNLPNDNF